MRRDISSGNNYPFCFHFAISPDASMYHKRNMIRKLARKGPSIHKEWIALTNVRACDTVGLSMIAPSG